MKLSTKGRYGVRAMFDLALHQGDGPTPLRSIAERQNISEHYLEQLIANLRKEGLVNSVRGAHGGYLLSKEPAEITIGDIIRVLEGPIAPVDCVSDKVEEDKCENITDCVVRMIWKKMKDSINEVLDEITLEDLRQEAINAKQNGAQHGYMYHI
ncbi:Rrf2 family transcriptional regulator [Natroniella sulfidigena]|uniref:RrF2 family transcriptional regulator n=1 Tax=Natroniella sulfidigena TaxID=723921 RepID=UPI00200A2CBB|nr:Rrf2 family transcriptional regulator [Natroniella sulfidigena]MCK8815987.1 Rrf2 family transcriptional regulator [Natroniella sulfidigena]